MPPAPFQPSALAFASLHPVLCLLHGRVDVVICLSTTVRNDTLQEVKEHRVSLKCRKQLRVEELEMVMLPETTGPVLSCRETGTGRWLLLPL